MRTLIFSYAIISHLLATSIYAEVCDNMPYMAQRHTGSFSQQAVQEFALPVLIKTVVEYLNEGRYKFVYVTSLEPNAPSMKVEEFLSSTLTNELKNEPSKVSVATLDRAMYSTLLKLSMRMQHNKGGTLDGYTQESVRDNLHRKIKTGSGPTYQRPPI